MTTANATTFQAASDSLVPRGRSLRDRLRLAAFGLALLVATMAAGLPLSGRPLFPHLFGDDLIPSYMAGSFVRQGRADLLMDYPAAERFQASLRRTEGLEQHGRTGPWLNPPFYALPFAPLSALPYRPAVWTWFGMNLALLGTSVALLYRMLPPPDTLGRGGRRIGDAATVAVLLVCSMPGLQAMACQQNTFLSLFLLTGAVALGRAGRPAWAGAAAGLLSFKPQLALIVWATLAATLGRRAVAGAAATVGVLALATTLAMPGALTNYLTKLPAALPHLRLGLPYPWERQVTATGFFRLLFQGRAGGPAVPVAAAFGWAAVALAAGAVARVLVGAFRQRRRPGGLAPTGRDRAIAAAIAATPLLMPYYMDYDLLLLAVPAVLLAAERCRPDADAGGAPEPSGAAVGRRFLVGAWATLFAWLFLNAAVADATGLSATVLLLAGVAGATAWRSAAVPVRRTGAAPATGVPTSPAPPALAAAA